MHNVASHSSSVQSTAQNLATDRAARIRSARRLCALAWQELRDRDPTRVQRACTRFGVSRAHTRAVLVQLASYASAEHADCYPTQERLADELEVSARTVRRALRALERLELVHTLTGADAWAVYGRDPRATDNRRNAYLVRPLSAAWGTSQRAPLVDGRTGWQRHHARLGWRQQRRAAARELERLCGARAIMLSTVPPLERARPDERPRRPGPRHGGALAAAATPPPPRQTTAAPGAPPPVRYSADQTAVQLPKRQGEGSGSADPLPFFASLPRCQNLHGGALAPPKPPGR